MTRSPKTPDADKRSKVAHKPALNAVKTKTGNPAPPSKAIRKSVFNSHLMSLSIPVLDASLKVSLPISNSDALLGVDAEWDSLDKLYDQTDDANRQIWIQQKISILRAEHTTLSTKLLHEAWDAYGPSQNIKDAAEGLKGLATELAQKAKALDIAATAITAISKFVNAL